MYDESRVIEEIVLQNGLVLTLHDFSRKIAGDRWLVGFTARIPIKVDDDDFDIFDNSAEVRKQFYESQGDTVWFEIKRERNFIDEKEKDDVLSGLVEKLKRHMLDYMGHSGFAAGVKRGKLKDFEDRLHWYQN